MENNFWFNRNVFVTGATGLLGSALCRFLVEQKANVVALIRDNVPKSNLILDGTYNKISSVRGELEDHKIIERALNEYEIETVFHLGAQTIVGTANRSPIGTFEANIKGTWNVLEACRNAQLVKRVVMASTDKAYGTQEKLPYTEEAPLQGMHPYDVSKSCADLIGQTYHNTYGLPVGITRCGNLYGAGDLNFNRIVPGTIRSIIFNEAPIIRSDGTFLRDYFYLLDAVDAYVTLAEQLDNKSLHGHAFNFSTNNPISVLDLVNKMISLCGSGIQPVILNEAKGEIKHQYLSSEKANKLLNWQPKHTLDQGLSDTISWYKQFFGVN
ncbi:GDP-mannose 4,6-dehydratase [Candidatus Woesearchaeota archaeon]|nr:GDP-mannose 4,6-dehydratase [Candidatus Woesearchaeota archaeon]